MSGPELWQRYIWRGQEVVVVQQWRDPFGRPMLRFAAAGDEELAAGMPVDAFLREAILSPSPTTSGR